MEFWLFCLSEQAYLNHMFIDPQDLFRSRLIERHLRRRFGLPLPPLPWWF